MEAIRGHLGTPHATRHVALRLLAKGPPWLVACASRGGMRAGRAEYSEY